MAGFPRKTGYALHVLNHRSAMKILEYTGLDTSRVKASYKKIVAAIAAGDFRAAQVKKLSNLAHGKFYRAKLDDANRLLFALLRYGDDYYALMLEVILNHDYDKSRFLRGAQIDDSKIPDIDAMEAQREAQTVRYLHPQATLVNLLDKPISFDDAQQAVYRQPAPLIVVGSAGSGKTTLTLEKLKLAQGEVLYVTHSAFLAQSARDMYYSNGYECEGQEAAFLSYREFVESIKVPSGREAHWRDFAAWFERMRQSFKGFDAHQVFEEIRGVLAAGADGVLTLQQYLALGIKQSIFAASERASLYAIFEKYRTWLQENRLYDLNLVAHAYLQAWPRTEAARYDFIVIDEVQDITNVQLALVLKTLKKPDQFLLCGDSNQIVHPNFFSWGQVKSLFWHTAQDATKAAASHSQQQLRVLSSNFRNGLEATRVANQLLKIKHRRFGSIDRESNFLVQAVGGEAGQVTLMADKDAAKRELDQKIRQSTQFAVLVMRDEDKPEAKKHFATPLLFSIHEAKGLEYENIVLYRFVSNHRAEFGEIVDGVTKADLTIDTLDYKRAKDKSDKSLEIYKFFVNALYVALTRAIKNLVLIESDTHHALFDLLDLQDGALQMEVKKSTLEDWQKEARKLELQGKQEQADAIRKGILKQTPVPWQVLEEGKLRESLNKVFVEQAPVGKLKQQLFEYAACFDHPALANVLVSEARLEQAMHFEAQRKTLARKSMSAYSAKNIKDVLRQCEQYGLEHRLPMNQTPLMAAASCGNVALAEALLERGADREAQDQYGCNPLHYALRAAFADPAFAHGPLAALYDLLAPPCIDINTGDRLVRIDQRISEYLLLQTMWAQFASRFTRPERRANGAFDSQAILDAWQHLPANILRRERNTRSHVSAVLSRNEITRDYAYNRDLFNRISQGWYQFNPKLMVRRKLGDEESWIPLFQALNLPLIGEFVNEDLDLMTGMGKNVQRYLQQAGLPPMPIALMYRRALERAQEHKRVMEEKALQTKREEEARREQMQAQRLQQQQEAKARLKALQARQKKMRLSEFAKARSEADMTTVEAIYREHLEAKKLLADNMFSPMPPRPPWGTPAAKEWEIERIRRETALRKLKQGSGE